VGFPLACRGRTIGAVVGVDRTPSKTTPRFAAATVAALLAGMEPGAIALENAVRVQRAEALSVTDDLTQLYNSRYLSQVLRRETKRASRSGRPLSLLFVDLDGFKSINDTHGHLFGSRALVEAASVIRASARETDMVARFGGDEFALILPDTGSDGAVSVGERVRDRIAAFRFLQGDGLAIHLTVSVGGGDAAGRGGFGRRSDPGRRRGDVLRQRAREEWHLRRGQLNGIRHSPIDASIEKEV
jgi:diguanylate cyclase (GGDEF)-like protein